MKIERETDRQRKVKYGTANGAAVEAMNSTEPPGEGGGETGEPSKAAAGGDDTNQGNWKHCVYSVLCTTWQ